MAGFGVSVLPVEVLEGIPNKPPTNLTTQHQQRGGRREGTERLEIVRPTSSFQFNISTLKEDPCFLVA